LGYSTEQSNPHKIIFSGRNQGVITGVKDVVEFDNNMIDLDTSMGKLIIKGKNMKVKGINLEKGEAEVEGNVDSIVYSSGSKDESFIKKLFK
jgi:sporulation protein YabP